jgi:hypothetical protein
VTSRFIPVLGIVLAACGSADNSPKAQCERQALQDPTVQSIYRGDQGNYTDVTPARANLLWAKRMATLKCMQEKGLAPPGGVEPIRPPIW